jgi:DNA-binding transcriptional MerR regulator
MKSLTIGQLAHEGGINPESVRFYEAQGLLLEPPRSMAGLPHVSASGSSRERRNLGFSLKEIKELLILGEGPAGRPYQASGWR